MQKHLMEQDSWGVEWDLTWIGQHFPAISTSGLMRIAKGVVAIAHGDARTLSATFLGMGPILWDFWGCVPVYCRDAACSTLTL